MKILVAWGLTLLALPQLGCDSSDGSVEGGGATATGTGASGGVGTATGGASGGSANGGDGGANNGASSNDGGKAGTGTPGAGGDGLGPDGGSAEGGGSSGDGGASSGDGGAGGGSSGNSGVENTAGGGSGAAGTDFAGLDGVGPLVEGNCVSEIIGPHRGGGTRPGIAYDAAGNLHVAYGDATDGWVRYAYRVDDVWHHEIAEVSKRSLYENVQLAVASDGGVHIAYTGDSDDGRIVVYRYRDAEGSWGPIETFDGTYKFKLGLDGDGEPFVVHSPERTNSEPMVLLLSRLEDGAFVTETLHEWQPGSTSFEVGAAVDGSGKLWIMVSVIYEPALVFTENGASFDMREMDFHLDAFRSRDQLFVDPAGTTLYTSVDNGVVYGLGDFVTAEDIPNIPNGVPPLITLDGDTLVAAYTRLNSGNGYGSLYRREAAGWELAASYDFDPLRASTEQLELQPIGFDPDFNPVVQEYPGSTRHLQLIELREDGALRTDVDYKEPIGARRGVVMDDEGLLTIAFKGDTVWLGEEQSNGELERTDLGSVHVYVDTLGRAFDGRLYMAGRDGDRDLFLYEDGPSGWEEHPVGAAHVSPSSEVISGAITAEGTRHAFYESTSVDAGFWHINDGANPGPYKIDDTIVGSLQVLFDGDGTMYLLFNASRALVFARWTGAAWQTADVTTSHTSGYPGYVNQDGNVCVLFRTGQGVTRSCIVAGSVVEEVIGPMMGVDFLWGAAIDSDGLLNIVYRDLDDQGLIGTISGANFTTLPAPSAVGSASGYDVYPSLFIDPSDKYKLVYFNDDQERLWRAECTR